MVKGPDHSNPNEQRLQRTLAAIYHLGQELVLTQDEAQIAQAVVETAQQVIHIQACALLMVTPDRSGEQSKLVITAAKGFKVTDDLLQLPLGGDKGITVEAARLGKPIYHPDVRQNPRYVPWGEFQARSEFCVPLKIDNQVIGVLNAESSQVDAFDATDQQLLSTLADVAAMAIKSTRAYQAEQRQAAEMTSLYHLGVALVTERDPAAIVALIFDELRDLLGVDTAVLGEVDPVTNSLIIHAVDRGKPLAHPPVPLDGESLSAYVVRTGAPLRVGDLHAASPPVAGVQLGELPHAWLGIPLQVADRISGCLSIQSYKPNAFGPDEERLLTQIAAQIAPVLENAQLYRETHLRLAREERLNELAHALGGEMELATLIPRLLPLVVKLTGADAGTVAVLDPDRQTIAYPFHYNLPKALAEIEMPANSGLSGEIIRRGQPLLLDDYQTHPSALQPWLEAGICSALGVPLLVGNEVVGGLGLFSLEKVRPFEPEAVAAAEAAGRLAAVAIQRARLFESERQRRQETEALREASLALGATLDEDQVLEQLLDQIKRVVPFDAANVMWIEKAIVHTTHQRGYERFGTAEAMAALHMSVNQTPTLRRIYNTRQPYIVPDTRSDPGWVPLDVAWWIRSWAGAPIVVRDEVVAFFSLDSETPGFYTPDHAELLAAFAAHAGVAIENARLFQAEQHHAEELERIVARRTAELQAALEQAQSADRLKSEFVSNVSHELRTPLSNIKLYLNLLDSGRAERVEDYKATLRRETDRLHTLIEDLLQLSRLDLGRAEPNLIPVDANQLVTTLVHDRASLAASQELTLLADTTPNLPPLLADEQMLMQVLANLVTNAVNYTPPGGTVSVSTGISDESVVIQVTDTGLGIPPDELPHLFERFSRGTAARKTNAPGTGLGLAICKEIVDQHQGCITVESQVGVGSTFAVWLPAAQVDSL